MEEVDMSSRNIVRILVVFALAAPGLVWAQGDPSIVLSDGGIEFADGTVQSTAAGSATIRLHVSGQVRCFDGTGTEVICYGSRQDGEFRHGVKWPVPRFTVNGDGTVTDNLTGLVWLQDADCLGGTRTWVEAIGFANTLADGQCGLSDSSAAGDWRLPNYREFFSLSHFGLYLPAVADTLGTGQCSAGDPFIDLQSAYYWTSTTLAWATGYAHTWHAMHGLTANNTKGTPNYAWAVRDSAGTPATASLVLSDGGIEFPDGSVQSAAAGGPPALVPVTGQTTTYTGGDDGDLQAGVAWPSPRFTKNGDGTVTDNLTGLVWLEDADCAATGMDWAAAVSWVANVNDGECGLSDGSVEGDWRLPNLLESMSLVTQQYSSPAIPNTAGTGKMVAGDPFNNVQSNYWTSTEYFGNHGYGLWTSATYGYYWSAMKSTTYRVWPVRGGS
jgi:hypothetical protein